MKTYGKVRLDTALNLWIVEELEPHVCIRMKACFPGLKKNLPLPYEFRNTPEICKDLVWFFSRYPVEMNDVDHGILFLGEEQFDEKQALLEAIQKPDYQPRKFDLKLPLRPYQASGVETFLRVKRILNADDVGLGKTAVAIAAWASEPATLPGIVVVQAHLPKQWEEQVAKFSDLKVHLIKGTKPYSLPPADVYVMKYSCIAGWVDTFRMGIFKSVVFDEMQEVRRAGSMKHGAAKVLADSVEYCLGLSATPVYNYGDESFTVLNVVKDGCLGTWEDFSREWVGGWPAKHVKDPKALGAYLREQFLMIRRTREETAQYLPPVNRIVHQVDYDENVVVEAEQLARQLAVRVTTGTFEERGQAARELDIMIRHSTGVSKARYVAEYVRILLENGESVLLAGWHRDVYDIWNEQLKEFDPVMYTGTESPAQKEAAKRKFTSGESKLMIISLRSGVGLDGLQHKASIVVFGELDWSPAVHEQVIGRLRRDGQLSQVTAIFLVSSYGSDPLMVDLNGLKASQAHGILNPTQADADAPHRDESRLKLLAERFLDKKNASAVPSEEA